MTKQTTNVKEVEAFIIESFEQNYELLRLESGHALAPDGRQAALEQVLWYYRKMRDVAEGVTETEVKLTLPEQRSPEGRRFTLEGVVDIVREAEKTTMYDVKTHFDVDTALGKIKPYEKQLNVYAHIWQNLRGNSLDETAIIATRPTRELRAALRSGDERKIERAVEAWNPCIQIPLDQSSVNEVIHEFGEIVDQIEARKFAPPSVDLLNAPTHAGSRTPFGTDVCRNCDVRFSCDSFRQYAIRSRGNQSAERAIGYYLDDYGVDFERAEWLDANMATLDRNTTPNNIEGE